MMPLGKHPPLTREQQRLVEKWMGLPYRLTLQIFGHADQDAISDGYLALCLAAGKFDPSKAQFVTYATYWVRAYVMQNLMKRSGHDFRIGRTKEERQVFFNMGRARRFLEKTGVEPTTERIAAKLGVAREHVDNVRSMLTRPLQYQHRLQDSDAEFDIPDARDQFGDLDENDETDEQRRALRQRIDELSPRERQVLRWRWLAQEQATLEVIGGRLNLSRERVRQIEAKAIEKLRGMIRREA